METNKPEDEPKVRDRGAVSEPGRVDETEFEEEILFGFNQQRLPWILAAAALIVYLVTLNRWLRTSNLPEVSTLMGWDWTPRLQAPLLVLLTAPFRWLPAAVQPMALNGLAALLAALNVALLSRCIALLPFDRTREARQRERDEFSWLTIRLAWVPPLFGGLALAFTLNFWEHATAFSGEMVDLLLFAWIVHSLLAYRIYEEEGILYRAALVYGLAIANNYAMIPFLPLFLVALVWIRGWDFFQLRFLARMALCGLAGLSAYLLLPAWEAAAGATGAGFWELLRTELATQKNLILSFPPWALVIISFSTLLPVLVMGIRWPANLGDTSAAGALAALLFQRLVHVVMLAGALSALLGAMWGPRALGQGRALLPLHFLAAMAVGYYSGYLLLIFAPARTSRRRGGTNPLPGVVAMGLVLIAAAASPIYLLVRHYPWIRARDGQLLASVASAMVKPLPSGDCQLISDQRFELILAEAALRRENRPGRRVLMLSGLLRFRTHHEQMRRLLGEQWPSMPEVVASNAFYREGDVTAYVRQVATQGALYYVHPSAGFFFETLQLEPHGMVYRVRLRPKDVTQEFRPTEALIEENEAFWDTVGGLVTAPPAEGRQDPPERFVARRLLGRALNVWAVHLQRAGHVVEAGRRLDQVLTWEPQNLTAQATREFNRHLAEGQLPPLDLSRPLGLRNPHLTWEVILSAYGPVDSPPWSFRLGRTLSSVSLFRQALTEFRRVHELYPTNAAAAIWHRSTEAMAWLGEGELNQALEVARSLVAAHPQSETALETLVQVHIYRGEITNALEIVSRQLAINPDNQRALLNDGALRIRIQDYEGAIRSMDRLLTLDPENSAARLNRAIARLQLKRYQEAAEDYQLLLEQRPDYFGIHYGLAECAYHTGDRAKALEHYRRYLELAPRGTQEYAEVQQRVRELEGGTTGP